MIRGRGKGRVSAGRHCTVCTWWHASKSTSRRNFLWRKLTFSSPTGEMTISPYRTTLYVVAACRSDGSARAPGTDTL
eukprot:3299680-Prymnesium_polylepis.1